MKNTSDNTDQDDGGDMEINKVDESMLETTKDIKVVTFKERLLHDKDFRRKMVLWLCLCFSSGMMGWVTGQLGPSLLDLKEITRTRLEEASFFLTSTFIGYLIGTVTTGAIYERVNPFLLLFIGLTLMGLSSACIPWCIWYGLMIALHILKGAGFGVIDTAGNSVFLSKFNKEKGLQSYMQTIHLMFAIGGFLSPIATAPFLMSQIDIDLTNSSSVNSTVTTNNISTLSSASVIHIHGISNSSEVLDIFNTTTNAMPQKSVLYQAYLISTFLCFVLAVPFLFMFLQNRTLVKKDRSTVEKQSRKLPLPLKCLILALMCLFMGIDNGMEDTFFGLFTTFLVERLHWTKKTGSYAVSVYWASFACGRLCAIFIGPKFKARTLLQLYIHVFIVALIGLFVSTIFQSGIGVWIFFPIMGFAVSVFFPSIFLLTQQDFIPVSGRISSLFMLSASLGSMLNPILIGYLMDNFSTMWYMYITVADGVALWVIIWIATYLSRRVKDSHDEHINAAASENSLPKR